MEISLKYARVERERRFLLSALPSDITTTKHIVDRYITGTRLRLREVHQNGAVVRKLSQKVRLSSGPQEIACTNFYLDDAEWDVLKTLPATILRKTRHLVHLDDLIVAVDVFEDGSIIAEIDDGEKPSDHVPDELLVVQDVSRDEGWTGAYLAESLNASEERSSS